MNVLHLSSPLTWRGGEQQVAYLVEGLNTYPDIRQWVVCSVASEMEKHCQRNKINYQTIRKSAAWDLWQAFQLKNFCTRQKINIIHTHDAHAHTRAMLAASVFRNPAPIIVARRVDFMPKSKWFTRYKYTHPQVAQIVCVSNAIADMMRAYLGSAYQARVQTVYSGVDIRKFETHADGRLRKELGISEEAFMIGKVAALAPHKDHLTFLKTAKRLLQEGLDVHFVIIGEGSERGIIETFIRENTLGHRIHLTGFRADIPYILPELDLFLMTSSTEGLGTSILDAFAAGVPVVATNAGGISEMLIHRETGMLAAVKDVGGLVEALKIVMKEEGLREKLVMRASELVKSFAYEEMVRKTRAIYVKTGKITTTYNQ